MRENIKFLFWCETQNKHLKYFSVYVGGGGVSFHEWTKQGNPSAHKKLINSKSVYQYTHLAVYAQYTGICTCIPVYGLLRHMLLRYLAFQWYITLDDKPSRSRDIKCILFGLPKWPYKDGQLFLSSVCSTLKPQY